MDNKLHFKLFIFISLTIDCYTNAASNYGPFNLTMTKITICNGPKRRDCSINTAKIINGTTLLYNMDVQEDVKDIRGNLFAISETKQSVRLQMKKLCDHPFWLPFMKKYVNITKNCVLLRGNYRMVVNAQELAQKYYGGSFIYGKWTFKSVVYSDDCNYSCSAIDMALTPKYIK